MATIRAFFPQIRVLFSNLRKRAGETYPPSPPLVTHLNESSDLHLLLCNWNVSLRFNSLLLVLLLLLLLFLLVSEVLNPKSWPIKASLLAERYFNPGSQVTLRRVLSDWARVQKSTVGQCEKHKGDTKKHQESTQSRLPKCLCRVLSWCQSQPYPQNLLPACLLIDIAGLLLGSVPLGHPIKSS